MAETDKPKNFGEKNSQAIVRAAWWQPAIAMFARLSAWIAGPVIIALFLGKWLDKKFSTAPWLFLSCTALAFVISMVGLVKNTMTEYRKIIDKQDNQKNNISQKE